MFVTGSYFLTLSNIREQGREPTRVEPCYIGSLLDLPSNIRLGKKELTITNTPAYYDLELIRVVKKFYITGFLTLAAIFERNCELGPVL